MSLDQTYAIGAIDHEGTIIRAPRDYNENPNSTSIRIHHAGRIFPIYSAIGQTGPDQNYTTPEIDTALGFVTYRGIELAGSNVFYFTKRDATEESTGSDHLKTTVSKGIAIPKTLTFTGGPQGVWLLGIEVCAIADDGLTAPLLYGTGSLPAIALIAGCYTGGKFNYGDVEVECWQSATLDFGLTIDRIYHKGLPVPVRAKVRTGKPTLRLSNLDPGDRAVFGHFGTRLVDVPVLHLRRNQTDDAEVPTRYPDADLKHIRLTFAEGIIRPGQTTSPEEGDSTQELIIEFDESATAPFVNILYNVAII